MPGILFYFPESAKNVIARCDGDMVRCDVTVRESVSVGSSGENPTKLCFGRDG